MSLASVPSGAYMGAMGRNLSFLGLLLLQGCGALTANTVADAPGEPPVRASAGPLTPPGRMQEEEVEVLVALRGLPEGTLLSVDHLATRRIPARLVSDSWLTAGHASQALRRVTLIPLSAGDPILRGALADERLAEGLPGGIGKEARAVLVSLQGPLEPYRYLQKGDRVDVLGVFRDPESNELVSMVVLADVAILATYRGSVEGQDRVVAVEVTPKQAQKVILAMEVGTVYAVVRGRESAGAEHSRERLTVDDLLAPEPKR